jgi:hypothetical protein
MSMVSSLSSTSAISSNDQTSTSGPPIYPETSSTASQSSSASLSGTTAISSFSTSSLSASATGAQSSSETLSSSSLVPSLSISVSSGAPEISSTSSSATEQSLSSSSSQGNPPSYSGGEESITTTIPPTYISVSTFSSQESPLPSCGAGSGTTSASGSLCQDPYGNTYNFTAGSKQYTGRVSKRAVDIPSVNACLILCNTDPTCVGLNYVGDACTLFRQVVSTLASRYNLY